MSLVSVIMPVYNVKDYLPAALDAAFDQEGCEVEVVCVDDGSTDGSAGVLDAFARRNPHLRVLHQANAGVSSARNAALRAARGDYLMFCDPDDLLVRNACARVASEMDGSGADILVFGATAMDEGSASVWLRDHLASRDATFDGFDARVLFDENVRPFIWRLSLRRELVSERGLRFDESLSLGEDQLFCFCAFPLARRVRMIPDALYRYRPAREGSLMQEAELGSYAQLSTHLGVVSRAYERWAELGILEENRDLMLTWLVEFVLYDALRLPDAGCRKVFDAASEVLLARWSADEVVLRTKLAAPVRSIVRASVRRAPLPSWRRLELMVRYYRWRDGLKALAVRFVRGGTEFSAG